MPEAAEDKKLYKIGEVCKLADVQPYVLRYWETEFTMLAPNKSGGGQRMYTRGEIDVILRIKQLLYSEGFTIAGAKKKLDQDPTQLTVEREPVVEPHASDPGVQRTLASVRRGLNEILKLLRE